MMNPIFKKVAAPLTVFMIAATSIPASAELSWFSRANCLGNNESISWDLWGTHWLRTKSSHYWYGIFMHCKDNLDPEFDTPETVSCQDGTWDYVQRGAAVHWGEATGDGQWYVYGTHYEWTNAGEVLLGVTSSSDCSINSITEFYDQFFG